ncbi:MAG: Translation initiation factor 3 [uncultured Thermomicrobiales bacterium]|uniref:Translation initiation factor IF-3 n=1 Tax=uncultured Thermomicrobiales bacterium TaxID=1645740 RepID=A0A6J4VNT1_9BACT|nr:MAG: Translation initiation factor 3 [uncultured Thermomicrobiales bacterium]
MARERGLDLVEVAPNAIPPVCRLMDYGKFRYEQSRKERDSRRNQHVVELKEIRIQPKIGDHDLETKSRQAAKFLDAGDKVKFTVRFRGREMAHPEIGRGLLDQLVEMLRSTSTVEQTPRLEGRTMTLYLAPVKPKLAPSERPSSARVTGDDVPVEGDTDLGDVSQVVASGSGADTAPATAGPTTAPVTVSSDSEPTAE